jgi:hypothetical protein
MFLLVLLLVSMAFAAAQTEPMSVCQMLDSASDHQEVVARVKISGGYYHGFGLSEGLHGDPCPGWRKRFFTAPSVLMPMFSSCCGVQLSQDESRMVRDFLDRLWDESRNNSTRDLTVTLRGVIVKKAWPWIFRRSDGVYMGNAFGPTGGYPAIFVIKEILSGF